MRPRPLPVARTRVSRASYASAPPLRLPDCTSCLDWRLFLPIIPHSTCKSGIDVALRMGSLEDSSLIARKIGQSPRRVIATPAYFEKHGEPTVPADLTAHQAIVYDVRGGGTAWTFRKGDTETSVSVTGRVRVTAAEGVRAAVLSSLGLAVASEWMFPELKSGAVKAVLTDWMVPPMELWAVFPTGRRASAKARAFVTFIEEELNKDESEG
jgi:DNA-binding transcriptional LysR family regulator